MRATQVILLPLVLLVGTTVTSVSSQDPNEDDSDSFGIMMNIMEELQELPLINSAVGPYILQASDFLTDVNDSSSGSVREVVDSIMSCKYASGKFQCERSPVDLFMKLSMNVLMNRGTKK